MGQTAPSGPSGTDPPVRTCSSPSARGADPVQLRRELRRTRNQVLQTDDRRFKCGVDAASDRQHDLADMVGALELGVSGGRLLERKGLVDDGLDLAVF